MNRKFYAREKGHQLRITGKTRNGDATLWQVVTVAVACRVGIALLWLTAQRMDPADVAYYWDRTYHLRDAGLGGTLREYPTPVAWFLSLPQIFGGDRPLYIFGFICMMLALDLGFCWSMWRSGTPHRGRAINFWSTFLLAMGPLVWLRFDLAPAVAVGAAALFAVRRPAVSGALLGLGAAIKLWPAALIALFANRRGRGQALAAFAATGVGLALISLWAGGWSRLFSPLRWQASRGLQVESIWATPLLIARLINPKNWAVEISPYQAYEVFGPGVGPLLWLSGVATSVAAVGTVAIIALCLASRPATIEKLALTMTAIIALIVVTNKTLSPQYIPWLAGPIAALACSHGFSGSGTADRVRRWAVTLILIAALSQVVYPTMYYNLVRGDGGPVMVFAATVVLVVRNLVLVYFAVDVLRSAWQLVHNRNFDLPADTTSASRPAAPSTH